MSKKKIRSLKMLLAAIVVAIVVVLTTALIVLSYNTAYQSVEKAYLNQINNFNNDIERQMVVFYDQQKKNAEFLASSRIIVDSLLAGDLTKATSLLEGFYSLGLYENVFVSTAEKNTIIRAAGDNKAVGARWAGTGFDDNILSALNGKVHVSQPYKSPITGKPVVLVTAPIKDNNRIIGILGLPFDLGGFTFEMVKEIKIGKTGYPFITDSNGLTFAHPNKENILKLDVKGYEWGRAMLEQPNNTVVEYNWEGKPKILTFIRNAIYGFIVGTTIYVSDINADARTMAMFMVIFGIIGIVLAGFAIYGVIANRIKPLAECTTVINDMAQGNLSVRYTGKVTNDEVGTIASSLNESLDQFENLISEVIVSSQNLTQAVQEISSGNENLSQRTSEQASSLEEVASTIEEATASIRQNADNAIQAKELTDTGARKSAEGGQVAQGAVEAINEINQSSRKIGEIISVINEIAFQTNLLALNAAVEAARAGEQGRGFAVVAGEVQEPRTAFGRRIQGD